MTTMENSPELNKQSNLSSSWGPAHSHYIGFEDTFSWLDDLVDAFVAYAVGFLAGGTMMVLFSVIEPGMSAHEIIGKIAVQALEFVREIITLADASCLGKILP